MILKQILDEMSQRWQSGSLYGSMLKRIKDLRKFSFASKPEIMLKFTRRRGAHDYSEARLNRRLQLDEVEDWGKCDDPAAEPEEGTPGDDYAGYFR